MDTQKQLDPKARILEVADHLFYTKGVRATGTEKIMALAEVAKATFYRHFQSKDDLVLAYLDHRDQSFWDYLDSPSPPANLQQALTRIERLVNAPEVIGCPFLRVAAEYPDTDHPFHLRVAAHKDKLHGYLAGLLRPCRVDCIAVAANIRGIIDGALSTRMVYGASRQVPLLSVAEAVLDSEQRK